MKRIGVEGGLAYKSWCEDIEVSALGQIENLCRLPFAFSHVAIMPDCHSGYGMPIGGVLATKGIVIPNAVGVDIGCGMCALKLPDVKTSELDIKMLKEIMGKIRKGVPVGFKHHKEEQKEDLMPVLDKPFENYVVVEEYKNALHQLGTLGGGNHFIEIQKDKQGFVWIMIHSGSRNLGKKVADHYNKIAVNQNEKWHSKVPKEWELAFLPMDSREGQDYLVEMQYCVDFALANRKLMLERIAHIFGEFFQVSEISGNDSFVNIAHNYARMESHFGVNVMVHRKGATLARVGTIGIIPGSQGSRSYIVKGLGNPESFESCSHGAGRKMSRTKAIKELSLEAEIKRLDDQGIVHGIRTTNDLDEAAGAYKPIEDVMKSQADLVDIVEELSPLAVIKG